MQLRAQPGSGGDPGPVPSPSAETSFASPLPAHLQFSDQPHWLSLLAAALTHTTSGISITANTEDHPVVYCNPAFERLTGYSAAEIVGQSWQVLQGEATDPEALARVYEAIDSGMPTDLIMLNYRRDGSSFWNALNLGPIRNEDNAVTHFIGVHTDVTDRVNTQRELEQRAYTDILTGLANRAQFMRELEQEAVSPESQGHFALGFIDLDGFKAINDRLGHEAGDELLRQVAQRLRGVVRNVDLAARLAGDEFVLLLRHVESDSALELIAQRTLAAFEPAFELETSSVTVRASLGLVRHRAGESAAQLLSRADQAMYQTKRRGKNDFTLDLTTLG
ncbi:GGDEF domain-containing protein [Deinococcus malanensis]|uniref:GGDEF domain-containing protein n=1 Tax=Deinococcus malanensis TaxID=1706855 RepID=UPI001E3C5A5C|nr:GGDEF domain-containing protein [Deinococcus malanensis]